MQIAFLGSSLLSSYWNGAATYYRGLIAALAQLGFKTTFYEPDAFDRQQHRDIDPPDWATVVVYPATLEAVADVCAAAAQADVIVKASGIGVFDAEILASALAAAGPDKVRIFWDVDAPPRSPKCAPMQATRCAAHSPSSMPCSPTAAARRWSKATAASARASAFRSTTRSIPRRTTPSCQSRGLPPTSPSSATACPTARRVSTDSSSRQHGSCPSAGS